MDTQTGVAYASTSPSQTLDLYLPASDGSTAAPVVVLIHGGAFAMGDSGMEAGLAQTLVQQGFAVAAVNYRLSGEALYPAGAQDVKAAVRWLRANAAQYGLDPDKFAAWGQSAGGWMATMLGVTGDQATIFDDDSLGNPDQSDAVQAVVSWYGPVDFATMDEQAADVTACAGQSQVHGTADSPESQWLGAAVDSSDQTDSTDLTSYLATAATIPAFSLAHGDADCNVPAGQAQQLKDALDKAGATSTLTILPGARARRPRVRPDPDRAHDRIPPADVRHVETPRPVKSGAIQAGAAAPAATRSRCRYAPALPAGHMRARIWGCRLGRVAA